VVESLETVWEAFRRLLDQVIHELRRRGCGAKTLAVDFLPADAPVIRKTIHLSRPTRDAAGLMNLLKCACERVGEGTVRRRDVETERRRDGETRSLRSGQAPRRSDEATEGQRDGEPEKRRDEGAKRRRHEVVEGRREGFIGLVLCVAEFEPLGDEQLDLLDGESQVAELELDHLLERLRARLGEGGVLAARLAESHLPERVCTFVPAETKSKINNLESRIAPPRPLHLLPEPEEIRCMVSPSPDHQGRPLSFTWGRQVLRLTSASGPERISGMWWEGRNKTRDYFDVEETTGRRFWIFRVVETRRWFLHGVFEG
jgi:hypothetical protein